MPSHIILQAEIDRLRARQFDDEGTSVTSVTGSSPIIATPSGNSVNISFDATSLSDPSLPLDQNSMVSSDFTHPFSGWQLEPVTNTDTPSVSPNNGPDPAGGLSGTILNAGGATTGSGDSMHRVFSPGTSLTINFAAMNLGFGATLTLRLWNAAINSHTDIPVTTTGVFQNFSQTFTGLTAGQYYYIGFAFSGGPSGAFNVANVQVVPGGVNPAGPYGLLASPFQRLAVYPEFLTGNHIPANTLVQTLWWNVHDAQAELPLLTDATSVLCEVLTNSGSNDFIAYRVNGKPWAVSPGISIFGPGPGANVQAVQQSLPANTRSLDIVWSTFPGTGNPNVQNYARAVYLPAGANVSLRTKRNASNRRVVMYGDSITVGGGVSPNAGFEGIFGQLKARFPGDAAMVASQGRQLHDDCATSGAQAAFAKNLLFTDPTDIIIFIGTNDYFLATWTATAFGTALTGLLADLVAGQPNIRITVIPLQANSLPSPNANGDTTATFNAAITTAVGTQSQATQITTALYTLAQTVDGVHPGVEGSANANRIISNFLLI